MIIKWLCFSLALMIFLAHTSPAAASAPYESYNYGYWETVDSPVSYLPGKVIRGSELGLGEFSSPEDIYVATDGSIYLLDSGNGRIVVFNKAWQVRTVIAKFTDGVKEEKLNKPQGIFVTEKGVIFVADTDNRRIVEMDINGTFLRVIGIPESDVLRAGFAFFPRKIALDKAMRIYVIGKGVYDGIMEFDSEGEFRGFIGTNRVKFNPLDYFWKSVSTKAQREKLALFLPVEFNNIDLDEDGFIYTTTSERFSNNPIQRLNPSGVDVLRTEGYFKPKGDLEFANVDSSMLGPSIFNDIVAGNNGTYSGLDSKRGRIFTYNEDGDLLYIFGQRGQQAGTFKAPIAIEKLDNQLIVLDRDNNHIMLFNPTAFGLAVNEAVQYYHEGKESMAEQAWAHVLKLDGNYEIAHIGLGKAALMQNRYKEAMVFFKSGHHQKYYSKAYTLYRKEQLRKYFGMGMTILIVLSVSLMSVRFMRRRRKRRVGANAYGTN